MRGRARLAVALAMTIGLGGCGGIVLAGLPLSQISTATTVVSIAITGKGLGEHGLDVVTGRDCRVLEGLMRDEREICEEPQSLATRDDFRGIITWLEEQAEGSRDGHNLAQPSERQLSGGAVGKVARFVGLEEPVPAQRAEPPALLAELAQRPIPSAEAEPPEAPEPPIAAGREPLSAAALRIGLRREAPAEPAADEPPANSLRAMALRIGLRREGAHLVAAGRALVERDESGPEPDLVGPLARDDIEVEVDTSFRELQEPKL